MSDKEITHNATVQSNALMALHNDDFAAGERARGYVNGAVDVKTIYEADRLKTREVVQVLVDAAAGTNALFTNCRKRVNKDGSLNSGPTCLSPVKAEYTHPSAYCWVCRITSSIALAKSTLNIEPSKP